MGRIELPAALSPSKRKQARFLTYSIHPAEQLDLRSEGLAACGRVGLHVRKRS